MIEEKDEVALQLLLDQEIKITELLEKELFILEKEVEEAERNSEIQEEGCLNECNKKLILFRTQNQQLLSEIKHSDSIINGSMKKIIEKIQEEKNYINIKSKELDEKLFNDVENPKKELKNLINEYQILIEKNEINFEDSFITIKKLQNQLEFLDKKYQEELFFYEKELDNNLANKNILTKYIEKIQSELNNSMKRRNTTIGSEFNHTEQLLFKARRHSETCKMFLKNNSSLNIH